MLQLEGGGSPLREGNPPEHILGAMFSVSRYMGHFLGHRNQKTSAQVGVIFITIISRDHCLYDVISPTT